MTVLEDKQSKKMRFKGIAALIAALAAAASAYAAVQTYYWNKDHPNQPTANAPASVQIITSITQIFSSQSQNSNPPAAPAQVSVSNPAPVGKPVPPPPQLSWIPLHRLSSSGDITFEIGDRIRVDSNNPNNIHIPFRVASQVAAHKIFALNAYPLAGWSLSTVNGTNCRIDADLHGLHVYNRDQFNDAANEIQVAVPGAQITGNILANCDKHINGNDMFYLVTQLYVLPEEATPGNATPSILNFNSEPIPAG